MVSHLDLIMYLVAIKSFYSYLEEGQPIVLDDGTLTLKDIDILNVHLSEPEIVKIAEIPTGTCPKGGCWERILYISDCVEDNYVIQLDSDTITINEIHEVVDAVKNDCCFTLGTTEGQQIEPMEKAVKRAQSFTSQHIQVFAERNFEKLFRYGQLRYVRGCAGFTGFAKKSYSREKVAAFSGEMAHVIGESWLQWGSEQVTSNYIIANSPNTSVLPLKKYSNFEPGMRYTNKSFLHFIGASRFKKGIYRDLSRAIVKKQIQ